jgi:hypothetical protein
MAVNHLISTDRLRLVTAFRSGLTVALNGHGHEIFFSVIFNEHLFLVPIDVPWNHFEFSIFVEVFVFVIDSPVYSPPESYDSLCVHHRGVDIPQCIHYRRRRCQIHWESWLTIVFTYHRGSWLPSVFNTGECIPLSLSQSLTLYLPLSFPPSFLSSSFYSNRGVPRSIPTSIP